MSIFKEGRAGTATGGQTYTPFTGDAGSGGLSGLVPAPAAGDGLAGKYLGADGVWSVPVGGGGGGSSDSTLLSRISALEYNIAVNTLRDLVKDGWLGPQAMTYGYADEFTDETGIDVAASTNAIHDGTSSSYSSGSLGAGNSSSALWQGSTANYSFTGADIGKVSQGYNSIRSVYTASSDFSITFTPNAVSGNYNSWFGVYSSAEDATFAQDSSVGGLSSMTNSWWMVFNSSNYTRMIGNTSVSTVTANNGTPITISRTGTTVTFKSGSTTLWTVTTSATLRIVLGLYITAANLTSVSYAGLETSTSPSMTLQSVAMTAQAAPTEIRNVLVVEPIDPITPNTDLMLSVSNDDGTTWTPATLALADKFDATRNIYVAKTTVAAAGTAVKWKVTTANTKQLKIHGIWTQWR